MPLFEVAHDPLSVRQSIVRLGWQGGGVSKAQIHAGGRGKGGAVLFASSSQEWEDQALSMLGKKMVTPQTGPQGRICNQVLLTHRIEYRRALYVAAWMDPQLGRGFLVFSKEGGSEVEASSGKDSVYRCPIQSNGTLYAYHLREWVDWIGEPEIHFKELIPLLKALAQAFTDAEATLLEVNPWVQDEQGKWWALDAKMQVDEQARFRCPFFAAWEDSSQDTKEEQLAHTAGLSYVDLGGEVGCLVNGAGLALATLDFLMEHGIRPTNFLDVGGRVTKESIEIALKILLDDRRVQSIFVNLFGGIVRCTTVAEGIIQAWRSAHRQVPLVVRLLGAEEAEARAMLTQLGSSIRFVDTLEEGALACQS